MITDSTLDLSNLYLLPLEGGSSEFPTHVSFFSKYDQSSGQEKCPWEVFTYRLWSFQGEPSVGSLGPSRVSLTSKSPILWDRQEFMAYSQLCDAPSLVSTLVGWSCHHSKRNSGLVPTSCQCVSVWLSPRICNAAGLEAGGVLARC